MYVINYSFPIVVGSEILRLILENRGVGGSCYSTLQYVYTEAWLELLGA